MLETAHVLLWLIVVDVFWSKSRVFADFCWLYIVKFFLADFNWVLFLQNVPQNGAVDMVYKKYFPFGILLLRSAS